eukprot:6184260-Pleurochrysis_carterae.AAC.3
MKHDAPSYNSSARVALWKTAEKLQAKRISEAENVASLCSSPQIETPPFPQKARHLDVAANGLARPAPADTCVATCTICSYAALCGGS